MSRTSILIAVAGLLLMGAGCGPTASPTPTADQTSGSAAPAAAPAEIPASGRQAVSISGFAFDPPALQVKVGTTVTWTNNDPTTHQLVTDPSQAGTGLSVPDSQPLSQGQSYTFTFSQAGTWKYICRIHPSMAGTVTVTP